MSRPRTIHLLDQIAATFRDLDRQPAVLHTVAKHGISVYREPLTHYWHHLRAVMEEVEITPETLEQADELGLLEVDPDALIHGDPAHRVWIALVRAAASLAEHIEWIENAPPGDPGPVVVHLFLDAGSEGY